MSSDAVDIEEIERWLLGELDTERAAALEARADGDGDFAERVDALRAQLDLGTELRAAFGFLPRHDDALEIPDYEILGELGRGGQGVVYRARQLSTGRDVALKVLAFDGSQVDEARFEREVDIVASLSHPHVVTVFDRGVAAGRAYVVMELIDGVPIDRALGADADVATRLALFDKVCAAVAYAHRNGVIHRDLKPANVLVDQEGEPHVLDFGLAKEAGDAATELTMPGAFVGTLAFAAPEQLDGSAARIDARADVHALGVTLYRLLTGEHPFPVDGSLASIVRHVLEFDVAPPSRHAGVLDADLDALVLTCLAKEPAERYATVEALRDDLRRWREGDALAARSDRRGYVLAKTLRRHRVSLAALGAVLVALLVATVISTSALGDARQQAERAHHLNAFFVDSLLEAMPGYSPRERTVVEWVDLAASEVDARFSDDPESAATIHSAVASVMRVAGDFEKAEHHALAALATIEARDGPTSREAIIVRLVLGEAALERGDIELAEERLLALVADTDAVLDEADLDRADVHRGLAQLRVVQGRSDEAVDAMLALLVPLERKHGPDAAGVLSTRHQLAVAQRLTGDLDAALATWDELIARYVDAFGPMHAKSLVARHNRAGVLTDLGRLDEALEAFEDLATRESDALGEANPGTLQTRVSRAGLLIRVGRPREALEAALEVADVARSELGERSHVTLQALQAVGSSLRLLGQNDSAVEILDEALRGRLATVGPNHEASLQLAAELAIAQRGTGDLEGALATIEGVSARADVAFGRLHPNATTPIFIHALVAIDLRRFEEAATMLDDLVDRTREAEGPDAWRAWRYVAQRGHAERMAGRDNAAAASFEAAWQGLCDTIGPASSHAMNAAARRADLAESRGDDENARLWRSRAQPSSP